MPEDRSYSQVSIRDTILRTFLYDGQLNGQSAYGLPQQTSVQFGENNYHFHGNYWDLYVQDEWSFGEI